MDGYVRVSRRMGREGPGYLSPSIQRDAIQRWADYRGVAIVEWHIDEDESGGTQNRPGVRAALERVGAGETDGIACWRLNRFARNVSEALRDVERVHAVGGALAFVEEDIDPTGPFGEFILTVLLAVAALELNNTKAGWVTAKASAMARGAVIGPTPFGYRRIIGGAAEGTLAIDEATGPIVAAAFGVAATRGLAATVEYLLEHGEGRVWTTSTVRRMLAQRCYLGEFAYGELRHVDRELQLVDTHRWHAAQPTEPKRRRRSAHYPLSGLATCGSCGTHMVGARGGRDADGNGLRTYRCAAALTSWRGERCSAPATTTADRLEAYVRAEAVAAVEALERRVVDRGALDDELAGAARALEGAEVELDALLADLGLRVTLGDARYRRAVELRVDAVEVASAHYRVLASRMASSTTQANLAELLRDAPLEDLGELLRSMLAGVEVDRGRGAIADRVRLVALDDEPAPGMTAVHDP